MRLFLAIDIPENIRKKLYSLRNIIPEETAKIKWVEENNIHLTLKFLGEVDEGNIDEIKESLSAVTFSPADCSVRGFGTFPNENYIKVIWAGIGPEDFFVRLHNDIDSSLKRVGFEEDKNFSPHVTIGRVRFVRDKQKLKESIEQLKTKAIGETFGITGFVLKKSTLTEKGPVYEDVAVFEGK